jgi:death-on-curing protein
VKEPKWLGLHTVLVIHELQLARFGGAAGIRDVGLLESALARPRQIFHYAEERNPVILAAAYTAGIIRNHPFVDGNKRTGFLAGGVFLESSSRRRVVAQQAETVAAVLKIAAGEWDEATYAGWLTSVTRIVR